MSSMSASPMAMLPSGSTCWRPSAGLSRAGERGALLERAGPRSRAGSPRRALVGRWLHGPRGPRRPSPAPAILHG
eukprot:4510595-Alexandrium_andersonii.AAC.1